MNVMQTNLNTVNLTNNGLELFLPNGAQAYFNYYWLRDNCPSSFSATTRERSFDIFHLNDAPQAEKAIFQNDNLIVHWAGEDHISNFPVGLLETYAQGEKRVDPADIPRVAWYSDHYNDVPRFAQPELMSDPAQVAKWIEALIIEGFAIVTDMPDSDEALTETAELIGKIRPTFFGNYFDVHTHINPTNTAYTAAALELHTCRRIRTRHSVFTLPR
jgi:gamma-butyrobetaine dioxygenase